MISVFSENPESDLWRELLQFSYEANINRYLSKKGLHATAETIHSLKKFYELDFHRSRNRTNLQGLSQILCKRRNAVQIEQNLFKAEVAQAAAALFSK